MDLWRSTFWAIAFSGFSLCASCDEGGADTDDDSGTDTDSGPDADTDANSDSDADTDTDADSDAECPAAAIGETLGVDSLMIGGSMDDESFAAADFDIGYRYVAGAVPEPGPCASCASGCFVEGESCANDAGCAWWGCWQWDQLPPGRYVADFLAAMHDAGAIPMITYYIWFSVAGDVEGAPEIAALADPDRVGPYLADFRFLCSVMSEEPTIRAVLHIEPDLWGYGHQMSDDPSEIPVAVSASGADECTALPDTLAGLGRCMLAIAREEAPNVLVGFHASAWGAGADALSNSDPYLDIAAHAAETATYMAALGACDADLVVVEMSDRDAAFDGAWWDAMNESLPDFEQAIAWVQALGTAMGLAPLWWQVPYGHMGLENVCGRYEDNRVDYVFDHPADFAAGGALGVAFGAGAECMTTPATDDGHFVERAQDYYAGSPPPLCGL